ncbi:hypothetical protein DFJ63DRAFT_336459 [Scheffersomyces coipomensis]|uniref:uncharacterized protein n=1 Tax=Scheffersomyces coipomensis TaxID=1788519 RepID=UPI00315CA10B
MVELHSDSSPLGGHTNDITKPSSPSLNDLDHESTTKLSSPLVLKSNNNTKIDSTSMDEDFYDTGSNISITDNDETKVDPKIITNNNSNNNNNDNLLSTASSNNIIPLQSDQNVIPPNINHHHSNSTSTNNNSPSTPNSYKGSRSEASDMTNDTSTTSVDDDDEDLDHHTLLIPQSHSSKTIQQELNNLHSTSTPPLTSTPITNIINNNNNNNTEEDINDNDVVDSTVSTINNIPSPRPLPTPTQGSMALPTDLTTTTRDSNSRSSIVQQQQPHSRPITSRSTTFLGRSHTFQNAQEHTKSEIIRTKKLLTGNRHPYYGTQIDKSHVNYVLAYCMSTSIRHDTSANSGIMRKLEDKDFSINKKYTFQIGGTELTPAAEYDFKFKDYCPDVFRSLRSTFGIDPGDYLTTFGESFLFSDLVTPSKAGKSGAIFFYSSDYRYLIKTIHHSEHRQLRRILKHYYKYVKENPNTLISQFYGLHRIKMPFSGGFAKHHFVVMNNLFPPFRDIHLKYDIKGSTLGRITRIKQIRKRNEETKKIEYEDDDLSKYTLKDMNFLNQNELINFGPQKKQIFFKQLESDVKFLKEANAMDYSLLIGIHDTKKGNSLETNQKLSIFAPEFDQVQDDRRKSIILSTIPRNVDREHDLPTNVFKGRSTFVFYGHDGGIRSTNEDNEPMSEIYYLGIIDCLTNYSLKKHLETFWRSLGHSRSTISALPADEYGQRFLKFIRKGTGNLKKNKQA